MTSSAALEGRRPGRGGRILRGPLTLRCFFSFVIAGLDPAIHAGPHFTMDHRVKPGGDEEKEDSAGPSAASFEAR